MLQAAEGRAREEVGQRILPTIKGSKPQQAANTKLQEWEAQVYSALVEAQVMCESIGALAERLIDRRRSLAGHPPSQCVGRA